MPRAIVTFFATLGLTICTSSVQGQDNPRIQLDRDVVFGKGGETDLKLDIAYPKEGDGPFPVVVFIHGGGWVGGNRQSMEKSIETMAGRGYVAATISYRFAPKARFPAQIEDCKAAIRWLRAQAKKYHLNPDRIGVVGSSAGGHLACLLGLTEKKDGLEGKGGNPEQSSQVQAVVSFFGPTDLTRENWSPVVVKNNLTPLLGGSLSEKKELYQRASPVTYIHKGAPPFLVFHGDKDTVVPLDQSKQLVEKLQASGVAATLHVVEGEGHGWKGDKLLGSLKQMVDFLDEKLKK